uniref:Evasin n=1 Tax=Rhipicephalus microplus TaxID=6941 RepID=A0A6G5A4H9_RHIMP
MSPLVQTTICLFCFGLAGIFAVNSATSLEWNSEENYPVPCLSGILNTTENKAVTVGCNATCLNGTHVNVSDNTTCVNISLPRVEAMPVYTNFSCSIGQCKNGTCVSLNRNTTCERPPVMWA